MSCKLLITVGFISILIFSCEKEKSIIDSKSNLLTNDSIKTWHLFKIVDQNSRNILPFPCIVDDEYKFYKNGQLTINNMGTKFTEPDTSLAAPIFCKDTLQFIDTLSWQINNNQDSMIIKNKNIISHAKIIKLIKDTLIIKRFYSSLNGQTEYYVNK